MLEKCKQQNLKDIRLRYFFWNILKLFDSEYELCFHFNILLVGSRRDAIRWMHKFRVSNRVFWTLKPANAITFGLDLTVEIDEKLSSLRWKFSWSCVRKTRTWQGCFRIWLDFFWTHPTLSFYITPCFALKGKWHEAILPTRFYTALHATLCSHYYHLQAYCLLKGSLHSSG